MNIDDLIGKITCADCLDILKQLPDKCVDLVLTDPPYLIKQYNGSYNSKLAKRALKNKDDICFMANDFDFESVANELLRISKNIVMFCSNAQISRTMSFFEKNGLNPTLCVWDKKNPAPLGYNKLVNNLEYIIIVRKKGGFFNNDLPIEKKFMSFRYSAPINKKHPAEKPIDLFCHLIDLFSKENDLVLDCFSGSGTTAVACNNLKRRFICIEKAPDYVKVSQERLQEAQRQQMLF